MVESASFIMDLDLIIFDLDGTLIDSRNDIANSVNYMLTELGLNRLDNETIYSFVGNGVDSLVKRSLTEKNLDKFDTALPLFRNYYSEHLLDFTALYPNVNETIDYFKSKKKAVVTNKSGDFSIQILKSLNIYNCFEKVICGDTLENKKPHPAQINAVINDLKADRKRSLIVGDGEYDITAGKNAGIRTCGLTCGFGKKEELQKTGPDILIDDIIDLKKHFS